MILPTKEDFREYSGEDISGKLAGDIKEQERLLAILFNRCYEMTCEVLMGIEEMNEENQTKWHELIMEEAEYLLSKGDASLMNVDYSYLSERIPKMAQRRCLWSRYL